METQASQHFQKLVDAGRPVGEIVAINSFLITVKGLQPVSIHSLVIFEDGSRGFTRDILEDRVMVLRQGTSQLKIGTLAVVAEENLTAKVGKDFVGRVISVTGEPLDGKGAIAADAYWLVFNSTPPIYQRELLDTQLETGVTLIDTVFPIVRGQRIALLGDSKSGKTTLATQIAINQRSTDQVVVYVLIAKRRSDVDILLSRLSDAGTLQKSIVVVSTIFESLVNSYLAPYIGCALGEYLWQKAGQDVVVIYDDLTAHAHAYREISLLLGTNPGRDSYPGDIFHAHSGLLERAGKLKANHHAMTAIPVVLTEAGDITTYLPTNIMSITDGQWILDMDVFRSGLRPALNSGLSVTRVGGVGQNARQKSQSATALKLMADYAKAQKFSHFGTEMAATTHKVLAAGNQLHQLFTQVPGETYGLISQQLMLDLILSDTPIPGLRVDRLKKAAAEVSSYIKSGEAYAKVLARLKEKAVVPLQGAQK
ncbi:sodium-transporting two-sector ATPase [Candidatus Saccharibacteria bacterium]|nr:sodium-transporting two-sector ATPase [Candidatus Saccharibacteria bacterium]